MIVKTYEIEQDSNIYIVNEYSNGTIEKYLKMDIEFKENNKNDDITEIEIQEQILLNTEYLVAMQELSMM